MDDALRTSPFPSSAGSPAYPQAAADAPTEPGDCDLRVVLVDRSTSTAVVLYAGTSHILGIDIDSADGSVGPAWWLTSPEVDEALGLIGDDLLVEILTDAYTAQRRDELS